MTITRVISVRHFGVLSGNAGKVRSGYYRACCRNLPICTFPTVIPLQQRGDHYVRLQEPLSLPLFIEFTATLLLWLLVHIISRRLVRRLDAA